MQIEFKGIEKLNRKLREVARKYPGAADDFLRGEAEFVKGRTKLLTPVDTGQLRASWSRTEPSNNSIDVYSNVEYAGFVEFGHRQFVYGRDTGRIRAGSFMLRDAIDECANNFQADAVKLLARIFH